MSSVSFNQEAHRRDHPLLSLPSEDLDLVVELVLRSGSLKDLATAYGVSYPTIRARLDKVISRLRAAVEGRKPDPLSELLAGLVERGELSVSGARAIKQAAAKLRHEAQRGREQAPEGVQGANDGTMVG